MYSGTNLRLLEFVAVECSYGKLVILKKSTSAYKIIKDELREKRMNQEQESYGHDVKIEPMNKEAMVKLISYLDVLHE